MVTAEIPVFRSGVEPVRRGGCEGVNVGDVGDVGEDGDELLKI